VSPPAELRRALRRAHEWPALATRVDGDVVEHVLYDLEVGGRRYLLVRAEPRTAGRRLSPRESQIAALVAEGWPTKAIAVHLGISYWTVGTYLRRVYTRFGVRSRAAMIARLLDEGLLPRHRV
jgi:two-component system, NarL family, nitrate/nitrite response regulator NarL